MPAVTSTGSASGLATALAGALTPDATALPLLQIPIDLPAFMREGHEIDFLPVYADAKMQTGVARRRRVYLNAPRTTVVSLEMTQAQLAIFDQWFESALSAGTEFFSAQVGNHAGNGTLWWKSRFVEPYVAEYLGGNWWKVSSKLMLFGNGSAIAPLSSPLAGGVTFALFGSGSISVNQLLTGGVTFSLLTSTDLSHLSGNVGFALLVGTYTTPASVGSAAGTSTATARVRGLSSGSAAGSSTAAAVGLPPGVGSAAGTGTATAGPPISYRTREGS